MSAPVDGEDSHDGIASHVGVPVLQTGLDGRHQRLQQLGLLQLAQEAQRRAADVLVRVLQVLRTQPDKTTSMTKLARQMDGTGANDRVCLLLVL